MLDDHKYSIGRLVVYKHTEPRNPRQSYGQLGPDKTVGEISSVDLDPNPEPHWVYSIQNIRNGEFTRVLEDNIQYATETDLRRGKFSRGQSGRQIADSAIAEMVARVLAVPAKESLMRSALKKYLNQEKLTNTKQSLDAPLEAGDYIRIKGELRKEIAPFHAHYAKILNISESDIAGIENSKHTPGSPLIFRTNKKLHIITADKVELDIYDAEVKTFYTAKGRKIVFNWRAATLLAETFKDSAPYNLEFEFLLGHIFTREELESKKFSELRSILAKLLYAKGRMGWRDYQRKNSLFGNMSKAHLVDFILETSRFDSLKNRSMTFEEITRSRKDAYKLRRLLKT